MVDESTPPDDAPPVSFRRLFGLARPHLRPLVGATALMLLASAIGLVVPMFAGGVVDTALEESTVAELRAVVGGLLGLFALLGIVGFFETYLLEATGARLLRDLRWRLFDRLVGLTPGFYDSRRVGELLSRLGSDLAVVQGALTHQIPSGLQASMRFIGTLVILFVLQTRLTLVALVVVPPVVLVAIFFGSRLQKIATKARDATADTSALAEESLAGIRTVQAHAAEPRVRGRYDGALATLLGVQLRNAWLNAGFAGMVTFASFSAFGLVLGYGGQLMLEDRLTAGELTSFLLYTFSVAVSVGQLGGLYAGYRELKGASARLFELLDTEPVIDDPAAAEPPAEPFVVGDGELSLDAVRFTYTGANAPALDGVTLDVPGGGVVALVGPSGSGKSTLFALLQRFYAPDSGTIAIDGRAIDTIGLRDLRSSIAVVPQEVFLFSGTIADNLRLGAAEASDDDLRGAAEAAGALGFIEDLELGFETEVGERGVRLSAGQRQRLAIARAFLADPRILLLDEATSSLDPDSEATVQEALGRLFVGRTTLVIAHRLATARRADVIHVLEGGRIVASGSHEQLYDSSELYRRYWTLQSLESERAPESAAGPEVEAPEPGGAPATKAVQGTYPGVYVEEVPSDVRPIEGVETSTTAFVGRAQRGPVGEPVVVGSVAEFHRVFGGLWVESRLGFAVRAFFLNGGTRAVVVRLFRSAGEPGPARLTLPGPKGDLVLEAANPGTWGDALQVEVSPGAAGAGFDLSIVDTGSGDRERFEGQSADSTSARFVGQSLANSDLVCAVSLPAASPASTTAPVGVDRVGSDGAPLADADLLGDPAAMTGLHALRRADIVNLLCIPPYDSGDVAPEVWRAALTLCTEVGAVLLIDPPAAWMPADAAEFRARLDVNGENAAFFFPRLRAPNPLVDNALEEFAPSGAVAGVIARTDANRGVWKAPAGLEATLAGVTELAIALDDHATAGLNPKGVNCLRTLPGAGHLVWGARTIAGDDRLASQWKYLPVRRTALYLEESLRRGTQWAVFEPNDEPLWKQLRLNVGAFMHRLFRQGAFEGGSPKDCYFVRCDRSTTTQADIDRGVVNVVVGFAPLKPAEFVVIHIQLPTADGVT